MNEVDIYLVQSSFDGKVWYQVTAYPGGRIAAILFSLNAARELIDAHLDEVRIGRDMFGPKRFRILKSSLTAQVIEGKDA
jgi:hypothetical protein